MSIRSGASASLTVASLVVIAAGVKFASTLIVPFLLSAFIATVTAPLIFFLMSKKVPAGLAIPIGLLADVIVIGSVGGMVGGSMTAFYSKIPSYRERLSHAMHELAVWLEAQGLPAAERELAEVMRPDAIMSTLAGLFQSVAEVVSQFFLVMVIVAFLLIESLHLRTKLQRVLEDQSDLQVFAEATHEVNRYLIVKTVTSLATGVLAGLGCWAFGLDLQMLWGLLAFLLNFIPTIGSVIAAIPPVLLAAIQLGPAAMLGIGAVYLAINFVIGNMVEPKIMGDILGLSPLVVLLSIVAWGWLLGPIGALLSAPLTMLVKRWLSQTEDFAWISVLLGPGLERRREPKFPRLRRWWHERFGGDDSGGDDERGESPQPGSTSPDAEKA